LLPVIGIVQVGSQAYADRYSYLPHIGLFIMIAFGLPCVSNTAVRALCWIGGIAAVAACAIATRAELPHWSGSQTLYERAIAVTTNNWLAHLNLGNEMLRQNNAAESRRQFESALRVRPLMVEAHYGLGKAYAQLGLMNEAAQSWQEAERLQPDYAAPRYSRALALLSQGQFEQAMSLLDEALRLEPEMADAHLLKGIVLLDQGRTEKALVHLQAATRFAPDNAAAAEELRKALELRGRTRDPG
jgi:tetratricopeptide (TPR) repeat protein